MILSWKVFCDSLLFERFKITIDSKRHRSTDGAWYTAVYANVENWSVLLITAATISQKISKWSHKRRHKRSKPSLRKQMPTVFKNISYFVSGLRANCHVLCAAKYSLSIFQGELLFCLPKVRPAILHNLCTTWDMPTSQSFSAAFEFCHCHKNFLFQDKIFFRSECSHFWSLGIKRPENLVIALEYTFVQKQPSLPQSDKYFHQLGVGKAAFVTKFGTPDTFQKFNE